MPVVSCGFAHKSNAGRPGPSGPRRPTSYSLSTPGGVAGLRPYPPDPPVTSRYYVSNNLVFRGGYTGGYRGRPPVNTRRSRVNPVNPSSICIRYKLFFFNKKRKRKAIQKVGPCTSTASTINQGDPAIVQLYSQGK